MDGAVVVLPPLLLLAAWGAWTVLWSGEGPAEIRQEDLQDYRYCSLNVCVPEQLGYLTGHGRDAVLDSEETEGDGS